MQCGSLLAAASASALAFVVVKAAEKKIKKKILYKTNANALNTNSHKPPKTLHTHQQTLTQTHTLGQHFEVAYLYIDTILRTDS